MAPALGAFIHIEGHKSSSVETKNDVPTAEELDSMPIGEGARYSGPNKPPPALKTQPPPDFPTVDTTPDELEMSRPSTPSDAAEVVQTWKSPSMNKWRILAACLFCFANGCNDAAPGALIPYMESHYKIGYAIVSTIFISNAVGFILAAFFVHALDSRIGRARTLMCCDFTLMIGYGIIIATPVFPVLAVAFFITGWGMATSLALNNVYCANLASATVILGLFHGSYGIGGIIAPIIATAMVSKGIIFSRFYIFIFGLRVVSFCLGGWAYWHFERDNKSVSNGTLLTELEHRTSRRQTGSEVEKEPSKLDMLKQSLKNRTTLVGAVFIFAYQGAEVSISGWVISFLINYRGSDPTKVGYVTAGFWGGITLGRFALSHVAHRVGEKTFTYFLIAGAIAFQLLVWFVPNVIGESVAVAIVGLLLGPIYPCATTIFSRLLPRSTQNTALAFVSSAGSSGGAAAPFLTGLLAQAAGTWVLHPICIALFVLMEVCWLLLPKVRKRRE